MIQGNSTLRNSSSRIISRLEVLEQPSWRQKALCSHTSTDTFFPEKGGSAKNAKQICEQCTVQKQCLDFAMSKNVKYGIWGSQSFIDRETLRKAV
jgi:WhiB family redox-sensing transcriptional regulator